MPNLDPNTTRIAATGAFWKAPLGTVSPTDSTTPYGAGWSHLGYSSDAGFLITQNYKMMLVNAFQTTEPIRAIVQGLDRKIHVEQLQSNKQNLVLAWGGATVVQTGVAAGGAVTFGSATITTASAHGFTAGQPVFFTVVAGSPGVLTGVTYFVISAPTSTTLTVGTSLQSVTPVVITAGTATGVVSASPFSVTIPDSAIATEFSLGIDWADGANSNRIVVPRATLLQLPALKFARTDLVRYPIEFQVLKPYDGSQSILPYGSDWAASA
jgi:hypothetical protein